MKMAPRKDSLPRVYSNEINDKNSLIFIALYLHSCTLSLSVSRLRN